MPPIGSHQNRLKPDKRETYELKPNGESKRRKTRDQRGEFDRKCTLTMGASMTIKTAMMILATQNKKLISPMLAP